jgi:hypothetical protein
MIDLSYKIKRIAALENIEMDLSTHIAFPGKTKKTTNHHFEMPNMKEIEDAVKQARNEAITHMQQLIKVEHSNHYGCFLDPIHHSPDEIFLNDDVHALILKIFRKYLCCKFWPKSHRFF